MAPIMVTDINSAELIKHAANFFLALKISYINALSAICEASGADIEKGADGIGADKRIGRSFLNAGLGYGGSCFPKDVAAFISISEQIGEPFPLLREVQRILALVKRRDPDVARSPCSDLRFHLRSTSVFSIASQRPVSRAAKSAC